MLRLDFNENLAGPSPRVLERLARLDADDLALYPDETEARAAAAARFGAGSGLDLVLTSGVDEGIRLLCDCFVRPGETVVLLEPAYPMYRFYATVAGAGIVTLSYDRDLSFPEAALRELALGEAARLGCRLVVVGNPNNPTGTPAPEGLIEDLAAALPSTIVLADEAYAEFSGRSSIGALRRLPNLVVARTFSKAYGLAGLRAGVLLGNRTTLSWVARMRSPYSVNSIALLALTAALEDDAYVTRYVEEVRAARERLAQGLGALGVFTYPSAANFLVARFGDDAAALLEALGRRGVLVRDRGDHPLLRGTLRIGVGTRAQAEICLAAVRSALTEMKGAGR
jgi:histidinol-phosphate aminotransferase